MKVPSTVEIKHQLLTAWLKDQVAKEAAEAAASYPASHPASQTQLSAAPGGRDVSN
jgi:hypothetical protein